MNKYNKVITNGTSAGSDYTYSRVVESNSKFVNYLRNPLERKSEFSKTHSGRTYEIYKHISGTTYQSKYYVNRYYEHIEKNGSWLVWENVDCNGYTIYDYIRYTVDKYNAYSSHSYSGELTEHTHSSVQGNSYTSENYNINQWVTSEPSTWTYG